MDRSEVRKGKFKNDEGVIVEKKDRPDSREKKLLHPAGGKKKHQVIKSIITRKVKCFIWGISY